jgi:ferric-dicitrate binding protein FerR (iron transport regulator)
MKRITPELLQKYLQGKCTSEENDLVNAWYTSFDELADDGRLLDLEQREQLKQKMLVQIRENLADAGQSLPTGKKQNNYRSIAATFYRVAAAITLLIAAGIGILYNKNKNNQHAAIPVAKRTSITALSNVTQSILRQDLSDGTIVWLKPNSSIEYPDVFSKSSRTIQLKGEAFFDVARDEQRPFIVTTGNVITKVLGTSFNIKAYKDASTIEVSVMSGKVAVQMNPNDTPDTPETKEVLLTPNERVTYVKSEKRLLKEAPLQLPELAMWQVTTIVYDNVPVESVLRTLEKRFNITIQVKNANLNNCLIRADFTNQNLADILEMLSSSIEATYELNDNIIYLDGAGCVN